MKSKIDPKSILLMIRHPHNEVEVTLEEWIKNEPGARPLFHPVAAKDVHTSKPLSLKIIPLKYRNNWLSRILYHKYLNRTINTNHNKVVY